MQRSTISSVTLPDAVTSVSTTLFIILFRLPSGRQLLPLLLWRVVEAGKPPLPEVPEVPEEDVEAVAPGVWYRLLLQVRKMVLQRRNHLRARNDPRGTGKRPPHHQRREKNRRRARSGPEADKGYLTLREGATRYGQFPRRHLLGSLVDRGNEVASYYVGKRLTVRLVRLARWVSRDAVGATRRAPHAGRPRSPRQTGA